MLLTLIARVPAAGVRGFQEYEAAVLPLLRDHGATLERRLRTEDGTVEVHVVRFPDRAAHDAYQVDPRRRSRRALLEATGARIEVLEVEDVRD